MKKTRRTIERGVSLAGITFHTGEPSVVHLRPALSATGIRFWDGSASEIAHINNLVHDHGHTTSLRVGSRVIGCVEHLLSAFWGLGITDIDIEVEGSEVPILDGSALPWISLVKDAGISSLEGEVQVFRVDQPFVFSSGISRYEIVPADDFSVDVTIEFPHTIIGTQHASWHGSEMFEETVAWARTFIADGAQGEPLNREKILARLASVDIDRPDECPCILYQPDRYLTPLRRPNEPATHKLLDFIGDFSLIGMTASVHIIAHCPGHAANQALVRALLRNAAL